MTENTTALDARDNLDGDFATLANVVAMVSWHLTQGVTRIKSPDLGEGWFISHTDGNEAMSALRMADQFAKRVLADLDQPREAR